MNQKETTAFRALIKTRLAELAALGAASQDSRQTVTLDQQSVGRLSRMDAMQQQAMATATQQRRDAEASRLHAALRRLGDEEFGICDSCGEDIARQRLELNPAALLCINCASA